MQNLIVVRHGNYELENGDLTDFGKKQVRKLTQAIYENGIRRDVYLASSASLRGSQTSEMILKDLDLRMRVIHRWQELFDEGEYLLLPKAKKIHKKVKKIRDKADTLILVSHFSVSTGYPTYFMQREFGDIRGIDNVPKGKAVLIDILKKDYKIIP